MTFDCHYQREWVYCAVLSALIVLSGCSDSHKSHHASAEQAALSRMLYSPNGEPLNGGSLGRSTCQDALSRWFDRLDANHDGTISRDEFLADAQIQFRRMDIDKNGYLVPEELDRFRQPYRQQAAGEETTANQNNNNAAQPQKNMHRRGASHGGHDGAESDSQSDQPLIDTSDPVMSADTNLDNKVTLEEFVTHAQKKFLELDGNHDGALSRDEVLARCNPK
jgi:Ca2+-binding EF-hand superfamily protein